MPRVSRPQVYRVVREMLPRERFGAEELLRLLEAEQLRNDRASRSHAKRRADRIVTPFVLAGWTDAQAGIAPVLCWMLETGPESPG